MAGTRYNLQSLADLQAWFRENAEDNSDRLLRLRRNLRLARARELTPRQQQILTMYFDQEQSMTEIARELGVNPSTVSRSLQRSKRKLYRFLRYGL